uniref:Gustatory receptor n=1 Tax=Rhabditophanes sp. KR3021 TaxID=114890 RepID=A0AC35TFU8_9BILA
MPFFPIDFSTNDICANIQKKVDKQLHALRQPRRYLGMLLGVEMGYPRPKSSCLKFMTRCHKVLLITVAILLLFVIIYQTTVHVVSINYLANCGRALLVIQKCMGFVDLILIISWQWFRKEERFNKKLQRSSNGIGLLKNRDQITKIHSIIFLYSLLRALLFFSFDLIIVYDDELHPSNVSSYFPSELKILAPYLLPTTLFLFLCSPIVYSILSSYLLIILAEYTKLSSDFKTDGNIYQLPVIRHYIGAHWKLCTLFDPMRQILSIRLDAQIPLNIAVLLTVFFSFIFPIDRTPFDYVVDGFLVFDSILHIIAILGLSNVVWSKVTKIREQIVGLVASERVLNEQSFAVIAAYTTYLQRNPRPISIFQFSFYNRTFLVMMFGVGCIVYLLHSSQRKLNNG